MKAEVFLNAGATLGEGPIWDSLADRLLWVDIDPGLIHATTAAGDDAVVFEAGETVGFVAPDPYNSRYVIGRRQSLVTTADWSEIEPLVSIGGLDPAVRINDGKLDEQGRPVFGTMRVDGAHPGGALYSWNGSALATLADEVSISNGLAWTADGDAMYYIDTPTRRLDVFDYDPETGAAEDRRPVVSFPSDFGHPDGMTIDDDGCLWIAFWGGSAIRRITPDGDVDLTVDLPATNPTSCAFGPDGSIYVTSARVESPEAELDGAVFIVT